MAATATTDKSTTEKTRSPERLDAKSYEAGVKAGREQEASKKEQLSVLQRLLDAGLKTVEAAAKGDEKKKKEVRAIELTPSERYDIMMLQSGDAETGAAYLMNRYGEASGLLASKSAADRKAGGAMFDSLNTAFVVVAIDGDRNHDRVSRADELIGFVYATANEEYNRVYGVDLPSQPHLPVDVV